MQQPSAAAIGGIVVRNMIPIGGMLVSGWRGPEILLLYFVDTMVSLAAVFTLLFMYGKDMPLDMRKPKERVAVVVAVLALTAFFGAVFGMPVLIVSFMDEMNLHDEQLQLGLLVQLLFGCVAFLTMSGEMRRAADPERGIKARFGFVTLRWVAVFGAATFIPWAPLLVLVYVVASIWLEIKPPPEKPA